MAWLEVAAAAAGVVLVVVSIADMLNTLVATHTSTRRFWFTYQLYLRSWRLVRAVAARIRNERVQHALLSAYAPTSVLLLLVGWLLHQVVGFGLIWWSTGGISGLDSLWDAMYFSGVVYFTVGFGEIVPAEAVPRLGALIEALVGVITIALVIGYLPSLYSAYAERERKLLTLDDGTEGRITPTHLVISRTPDRDPRQLDGWFESWEDWIAGVMETHSTYPMLMFLRSKHPGQSWITALGLMCDAAIHMEIIRDGNGRAPYWMLRRAIRLLDQLTVTADLSEHRAAADELYAAAQRGETDEALLFADLYRQLEEHGFELLPFEEAQQVAQELRIHFDARLEWLIDTFMAPRGFWGHAIGHRYSPGVSMREES